MLIQYLSVSAQNRLRRARRGIAKSRSRRSARDSVAEWPCALPSCSQFTRARYTSLFAPVSIHFVSPPVTGHHAHAHNRIRLTRLRKSRVLHRARQRAHVHNRIARHGPLIHLGVSDLRRIRRPPVGSRRSSSSGYTQSSLPFRISSLPPLVSSLSRRSQCLPTTDSNRARS